MSHKYGGPLIAATYCTTCGPIASNESAIATAMAKMDLEPLKTLGGIAGKLIAAAPQEAVDVCRMAYDKKGLRRRSQRLIVKIDDAWPLGLQTINVSGKDGGDDFEPRRVALRPNGELAIWSDTTEAFIEYGLNGFGARSHPFGYGNNALEPVRASVQAATQRLGILAGD